MSSKTSIWPRRREPKRSWSSRRKSPSMILQRRTRVSFHNTTRRSKAKNGRDLHSTPKARPRNAKQSDRKSQTSCERTLSASTLSRKFRPPITWTSARSKLRSLRRRRLKLQNRGLSWTTTRLPRVQIRAIHKDPRPWTLTQRVESQSLLPASPSMKMFLSWMMTTFKPLLRCSDAQPLRSARRSAPRS